MADIEEQLSSGLLAAVVSSSQDAIVSKDLNGIVTSWNEGARQLFGYSADEMVGTSVLRLIPPELLEEEGRILALIRSGQRIERYETVRVRKDGTRVSVSLTVSPVRDAEGRVVGASKIARDVGELRERERAQAVLAAIVESSDDAIVSKDLNGIVMSWNPAAERIFGWTAAEMIGRSILTIIPPELRHEEDHILGSIRAGRRVDHFETERVAKDGRRVYVSLTVSAVRDATGRVIGASKIARDVTRQRDDDRARSTLAAIVESSDDAIVSKNLDGLVTSWNRGAERIFGWTAAEMVGASILRIIPPELHEEEYGILARIRAGERVDHFETVRLHKDGRRIEVSITVSPVRDAAGRVIGASKIGRDVTEQREAQRRKDEFLAILAHELRNPLAPVRYAIAMLRQEGVGAERRRRSEAILERQTEHMARLLDDLLDASRVATGKVELKRARVELRPLVASAVDAVRMTMDEKRHDLRVSLADEAMWLDADPVRISQILVNLLSNAAKYTDPGGRIDVATAREDEEAVIRVKDNGAGFAPEMKPRLFTLFTQLEPVLDRSSGGLGIGLALVREFVERHGGRVEAHSAGRGKGSEFVVRLPRVAAPA